MRKSQKPSNMIYTEHDIHTQQQRKKPRSSSSVLPCKDEMQWHSSIGLGYYNTLWLYYKLIKQIATSTHWGYGAYVKENHLTICSSWNVDRFLEVWTYIHKTDTRFSPTSHCKRNHPMRTAPLECIIRPSSSSTTNQTSVKKCGIPLSLTNAATCVVFCGLKGWFVHWWLERVFERVWSYPRSAPSTWGVSSSKGDSGIRGNSGAVRPGSGVDGRHKGLRRDWRSKTGLQRRSEERSGAAASSLSVKRHKSTGMSNSRNRKILWLTL